MQINSPTNAFKRYFLDVKPYHTKILEIIERYIFNEDLKVKFEEKSFFNIDWRNDPLCHPTGYGWVWDDSCGFDAVECCDLFECIGGYGLVYDNSGLVMEVPVNSINSSIGTIEISGNFTFDTRLQINSIPTTNTILFQGDVTSYFIHQKIFLIVPIRTIDVFTNTENTITIKGNYVDNLLNKGEFRLYNTGTDDGIYKVLTAIYDPVDAITTIELLPSQPISSNITNGIIEFKINSKNNGAYFIDTVSFNGAVTTVKVKNDAQLQFTNTTENNNHGSLQLRTGFSAGRVINIEESSTANNKEYLIIRSEYDNSGNQTTIHVASIIPEDSNDGVIRMYGYIHNSGFDGAPECSTPQHSNIKVGIGEFLQIQVFAPQVVTPSPTPMATSTPTMTASSTVTPTMSVTPTVTPTLTVTPTPSL